MNKFDEQELLKKYREGKCSEEELRYIEAWYADWQLKDRAFLSESDLNRAEALMREAVMVRIGVKQHTLWPRITAAAAALLAIVFGIWFYNSRYLGGSEATRDLLNYSNDIKPGKNTATLTLADGKTINLSDTKTGVIITDDLRYNDGTNIASHTLAKTISPQKDGRIGGLTVTTPRGGTYQVILPDDTKVWLNAASSLSYTISFKKQGTIRRVKLTGEAYFEVKKDEASAKTTLLEGSVKVSRLPTKSGASKDLEGKTLMPGQQAILINERFKVVTTNLNEAVAWKDGYFRFYEVDLQTFMNTIARWYDIEVYYEGGINQYKGLAFGGSVSRSKNISEVLKILAQTGKIQYKIEGKKVTITL